MTSDVRPVPAPALHLGRIVGFLVCVELASGILQGYYTPIFSDIADHLGIADAAVNWFEAAQLIVSALVVPFLSRLGDLVGHKKVLLLSTAVLGRWFCGWACHVVALQDGARWLLGRFGIRPRPVQLGLLASVPWLAFAYMFLSPLVLRLLEGTGLAPAGRLQAAGSSA